MSKDRTNVEKLYDVIKRPIITEKSMMATTLGQYTFEVNMNATKVEIKDILLDNTTVKAYLTAEYDSFAPNKLKALIYQLVKLLKFLKLDQLNKVYIY